MPKYYTHKLYCNLTGIALSVLTEHPSLNDFSVSTTHNYSKFKVANTFAYKSNEELCSLSNEILAGLTLTIFNKYGLFPAIDNAKTANFMLASMANGLLVNAIIVSRSITTDMIGGLPKFDLTLKTHTTSANDVSNEKDVDFSANFKEYLLLLLQQANILATSLNIIRDMPAKKAALIRVEGESYYDAVPASERRATQTISKELQEKLVSARIAYKEIAPVLVALDLKKLSTVIKTAISGETIKTIEKELADKLVLRLHTTLELVTDKETRNSLATIADLFAYSTNKNIKADTVRNVERASDLFTKPKASLADILKAKRELLNATKVEES